MHCEPEYKYIHLRTYVEMQCYAGAKRVHSTISSRKIVLKSGIACCCFIPPRGGETAFQTYAITLSKGLALERNPLLQGNLDTSPQQHVVLWMLARRLITLNDCCQPSVNNFTQLSKKSQIKLSFVPLNVSHLKSISIFSRFQL